MQTITYKQAAELLGVEYITIKQAVTRGALSKTPRSLLIREQVELFKNKRISQKALSIQEQMKWEKYAEMASETKEEMSFAIKNIEIRQEQLEQKIVSIEKISRVMDECLKIISNIYNETGMELPKELKENFPHLPLVHI